MKSRCWRTRSALCEISLSLCDAGYEMRSAALATDRGGQTQHADGVLPSLTKRRSQFNATAGLRQFTLPVWRQYRHW